MRFQLRKGDILYVDVQISHAVEKNTTTSNSVQNILSNIIKQIDERAEATRFLFVGFEIFPGIAFLFLILRMSNYRHKFLTKDEFDNCYVNKMLAEIDIQRDGMDIPIRESIHILISYQYHQ